MKKLINLVIFAFVCLTAARGYAGSNCVATAGDFQTALTAAQTTSATITLCPNTTYRTLDNGGPFKYAATVDDVNLVIIGAGMGSSVLDGTGQPPGTTPVLDVSSTGLNSSIELRSFTTQNGLVNGLTLVAGISATTSGTDSNILLDSCEVKNNTESGGKVGGARVQAKGTLTVTNSIFSGNTGSIIGGGSFFGNTINFSSNTFSKNQASGSYGGASVQSAFGGTAMPLTMDSNIFTENSGTDNGGGAFEGSTVFFTKNIFINNSTTPVTLIPNGAAYVQAPGGLEFINNLFARNTNTTSTASINTMGAGVFIDADSTIDIVNNTIANNSMTNSQAVGRGGGLFVLAESDATTLNFYNNILFGNSATTNEGQDIFIDYTAGPNATLNSFNNDFSQACFDGSGSTNCDPLSVAGLNQGSNLGSDPLFVDPSKSNFNLQFGSAEIDSGDPTAPSLPTTDLAGNPRVFGDAVDMGALEAIPQIVLDPMDVNFGNVKLGENGTQVVTLTNNGGGLLNISGLVLSDSTTFSIDLTGGPTPCGTPPIALNGGASCTFVEEFLPSSIADFAATLTVSSNDPIIATVVANLTGSGVNPSGGGGCEISGASSPVSGCAVLLMFPLLWAVRRKLNS